MIKKLIILSGIIFFSALGAQKTHTVEKGDNLYNIAKKYNMSLDELVKLNPNVKDGKVNIGDVISVGNKKQTSSTTKPTTQKPKSGSNEFGYITLKPKQTLYGITKQYNVTEEEIRSLNPNLEMKIGESVKLPLANIKKYGDADTEIAVSEPTKTSVAQTTVSSDSQYEVQPKDNYYRITKKFGLTQSQLFALNPGLEEKGLQPGEIIRIKGDVKDTVSNQVEKPAKAVSGTNSQTSAVEDDFVTYTVQSGDTVFGIVNKYGITLDELLSLNPSLSNGLKVGTVLKIKKVDQTYVKKSGDALSVVIMLPFGFDTNDSKYRAMSADFLSGAKLAIERNARLGQRLDIKVIDAGNEANFKNSLTQINAENTDLIIGPFFKSNVVEVLDFVGSKKIPVVAPFANAEELYGYNNLILAETSDNFYAERMVKEATQVYSNQKIYIVADEDRTYANLIKNGLEKSVKSPNVIIVGSASEIQADQNMMTGSAAPVIAILASDDDKVGSVFSSRMIELGGEVSGVRAFSMYYHPTFEKKVDELSQVNLVYLMDRKLTDGEFEKEVIADYKEKYCKTPPKYAIIGFDVVNDILSRENKKGEVFKQISKSQTQLSTKFEYVRAKNNGAYINSGYRVVRLVP